ncbi:peptidoglycan-binding protein [Nitratireductor sp. GCM10026969]|uniref:peptidoglycan-binding protein n=1 Tax=Nitratireductor sp. GCM10026969 TaxID=3252645 RepID=UPI003615BA18
MTFAEWLQSRLSAHGFRVAQDGAIGGETRRALVAFQRANDLKQSGVADAQTVEALRMAPGRPSKEAGHAPQEIMPPWMAELHRRVGLHERRDNAVLSMWLRGGKFLGNPAKLPWCGDAIETAIVKTLPYEPVPNNPFWAQAWADFGIDAGGPKVGALGVIRWNANAGHVGTVAEYDAARRRVKLLGGNQSNSLRYTWFDLDDFIAFRWPKSFPFKSYPPVRATAGAGDLVATR